MHLPQILELHVDPVVDMPCLGRAPRFGGQVFAGGPHTPGLPTFSVATNGLQEWIRKIYFV